ncbi:MAG: hypothetical protein L6290_12840 [Thermodesulfovibrionales bacterium]|nr:hypothetical protein [Thermodesulfovibrionales bacterium]
MYKRIAAGNIIPCLLSMAFLFACSEGPKNPVAEYGDALTGAYKRGQQAGETANLDAVKKTVGIYRATHDNYPQSLDDIKDLMTSKIDLSRYEYNPENGAVSLKE